MHKILLYLFLLFSFCSYQLSAQEYNISRDWVTQSESIVKLTEIKWKFMLSLSLIKVQVASY